VKRPAILRFTAAALLLARPAVNLHAQTMPKVGDIAPDFTLAGATKNGLTEKPIHLSDLKGQTVVLAFFPKARTKG
jgi:peroxiredoxin Q/BCP